MNRFRFRLESVLRLRGAEESRHQREFGIAEQNLRNAEERRRAVEEEIAEQDRAAEDRVGGRMILSELMAAHRYGRLLERREESHEQNVRKAAEIVEARRVELVEATRRRKTIERLRERALEEYRDEVRKEEQNVLDDLTSVKSRPEERDRG